MERELVTEQRLLDILNEKIQRLPDCDGTEIRGDLVPLDTGPSGRNWEFDGPPRLSYENGRDLLCEEQIKRMLEDAYLVYNIERDSS